MEVVTLNGLSENTKCLLFLWIIFFVRLCDITAHQPRVEIVDYFGKSLGPFRIHQLTYMSAQNNRIDFSNDKGTKDLTNPVMRYYKLQPNKRATEYRMRGIMKVISTTKY